MKKKNTTRKTINSKAICRVKSPERGSWGWMLAIYGIILGLWVIYRAFFHNSVWIEEVFIKGAVFILPLFLIPVKKPVLLSEIGVNANQMFQSTYFGVILGLLLGLVGQAGNMIRHQELALSNFGLTAGNIGAFLILSLVTAFWEQLLFSGYILTYLKKLTANEVVQVGVTGVLFGLIHLPALVWVQSMNAGAVVSTLILLCLLGISCAILKLRMNNLIAPIMAHALWGVTVFLFR